MTHAADFENRAADPAPAARLINPNGGSRILLVCEHASNRIPVEYSDLGLGAEAKQSHAAWDPGALALSEELSETLDAKLVASTVSRLVYDCNRPPEAADAMAPRSEVFAVPGNVGLTDAQRQNRIDKVYQPFKTLLAETLAANGADTVMVTIHSFTPVYLGQQRSVKIGAIHHDDARLAEAFVALSHSYSDYRFALNEPYSQSDGVTHTLQVHGTHNGLMNIMIEVRNDLLKTTGQIAGMAELLAGLLRESLRSIGQDVTSGEKT